MWTRHQRKPKGRSTRRPRTGWREENDMTMARKVPKMISKLCRLRLTNELEEMIRELPVKGLEETQVGNHVYMGRGMIRVGTQDYPVQLRVWIDGDTMRAAVRAKRAGLEVYEVLGGPRDILELPEAVREAVRKCLN